MNNFLFRLFATGGGVLGGSATAALAHQGHPLRVVDGHMHAAELAMLIAAGIAVLAVAFWLVRRVRD